MVRNCGDAASKFPLEIEIGVATTSTAKKQVVSINAKTGLKVMSRDHFDRSLRLSPYPEKTCEKPSDVCSGGAELVNRAC